MENQTTEVLVLGAGPGGYTAAFRAADLGKKVMLVDSGAALGGVCLNVGCIPSKALLHAARVIAETREMSENGVSFGPVSIDLDRLRAWKDGVVGRLTGGLATLARQRTVTTVRGYGRFTSPHELAVELGAVSVGFEHAIIAAGSEAITLPFIPASDPRVIDSTGALEVVEVPGRLLVIGGGIIGLEMATVYHELGAQITRSVRAHHGADSSFRMRSHAATSHPPPSFSLMSASKASAAKPCSIWLFCSGMAVARIAATAAERHLLIMYPLSPASMAQLASEPPPTKAPCRKRSSPRRAGAGR